MYTIKKDSITYGVVLSIADALDIAETHGAEVYDENGALVETAPSPFGLDELGLTFEAHRREGNNIVLVKEYDSLTALLADVHNRAIPQDVVIYPHFNGEQLAVDGVLPE